MKNIFGTPCDLISRLRETYIVPPFSVLDANNINWKKRKRKWKKLGIQNVMGRNTNVYHSKDSKGIEYTDPISRKMNQSFEHPSIFDPVLCEIVYHWFSKETDSVLDPFAGGAVRGIVASVMKRKYTGIEVRPKQVKTNKQQIVNLSLNPLPTWIVGDANKILSKFENNQFDLVFTCPPYGNLEVYNNIEGELSNMSHKDFLLTYDSIICQSVQKMKPGAFAIFTVGEYRDKTGNYVGFVPHTIKAFAKMGCGFYNEIILYTSLGTAALRARQGMKNKKVCKVHQNVLVFKKEDL